MTSSDESRTTAPLTQGGEARVEPVLIEARDGPGSGASLRLASGSASVGSASGVDLQLADATVSGRHLLVELLPGAVKVRDLKSRNGTFYLGARIEEARVPLGGSARVGKTTLHFRIERAAARVSEREELHGLVGRSLPMRQLFAHIEQLGPSEVTMLITGETGSGKEGVARALHASSPRAEQPFVVFDCGAVAPTLMESELFGHAKGAFTGANKRRAGALERAHGGTLFLDEIGELPLELQPKLLRALEKREFRPVGENELRSVDVRLISATHRDLVKRVEEGRFRQDLFYRLAVATIEVPPLRNRPEDIPLLAQLFARSIAGLDVALSPATLAALQCDPWPGNVRELRNAVERVLALGESQPPAPPDAAPPSFKQARDALLDRFERDYLASLLARSKGNVSAAARAAKLSRAHFYRLMERHKLGEGEQE